jgi:hypothetical protein
MARIAALLTCLALAGCRAAISQTQSIDPGTEVTLTPGTTVFVKGARMQVRFVAVSEDSRCPSDVTCIWAGEVKITLMIAVSKVASQVEILEGGSTAAGAYRVTLLRVEPQRTSTARIAPRDYRATLKID